MAGLAAGSAPSSVVPLSPKSQQEMSEKSKSLKRRFEEHDEECGSGINRPDERKVRMREEQDHIRAAIKEIESRVHSSQKVPTSPSKSTKAKQDSVVSRAEGDVMNGSHALESLRKAANSPRVRTSGQPTQAARSNALPNHNLALASSSTTNSQSSRLPASNGAATQTFPRNSPKIAVRRSQRHAAGGSSSIAAVTATAAQAEVAAATPQHSTPENTRQDVLMTDGTTEATATDPTASTTDSSLLSTPSAYSDFGHTPSMESIVRVAEAAIAAQNAAKITVAGSPHQGDNVDPNLDPSLIAESSSSSTPSSNTTTTASSFANKPPPVDTTSMDLKASDGTPSATSSSASSNLSNNPYLALATNYPRGSGGSPTGHPMFFPYPLFYPGATTPATPGSPAYQMPYNPYYYLAPPMVPTPNGVFPSPANFPPPQPQQSSPPSSQVTQQTPSPQADSQKVVKPKRLKAHTVTTKSFSIPMVPRDRNGKPMLPLNVGIMTVISLGNVCMRDHFHTERYIFPVGYEVTRRYLSTIDANAEVVYHCTILDGGDGPKFQIIPSDRPDKPVIAGTATGAWSSIVKQANAIRNRQHSNSVSGPDFFGLGQNTIKHLIQELPNADKLKDYVWQNFVEGGPLGGRHAAVIPALPEEYDASLPIGAYYPRKNETPDSNLPRGLSYYPQHIIAQAESQKVAKTAQSQGQPVSVAGPSGSGISTSPLLNSSTGSSQPEVQRQTTAIKTQRTKNAGNGNLLIQEYQSESPAPSQESQPQPQKRVTRSSAAAANASASVSGSATSATNPRQSKSTPKTQQNQKQTQPLTQTPMSVSAGPPAVNGDGGTPMTFAGIMKAYPGPHLTLMTDSTGAAGS